MARDLDGDGHPDYVVQEFRRLSGPARLEARIAVYLHGAPAAQRPTWASDWARDDEGEYHLEESIALTKGSSLLEIAFYGGDADLRTIIIVRDGSTHVDIEHQVGNGQGFLTVGRKGEGVFIDASVRNLVLRGVEISPKVQCTSSQWAMIHLHYDVTQRRFVPGRRYCVSARRRRRISAGSVHSRRRGPRLAHRLQTTTFGARSTRPTRPVQPENASESLRCV